MIEWANESDEFTPKDRRDYIAEVFSKTTYGEDSEAVTDILADLMHYCKIEGEDFEAALDTARMHFEAEITEKEVYEDEDSERTCESGNSVPS